MAVYPAESSLRSLTFDDVHAFTRRIGEFRGAILQTSNLNKIQANLPSHNHCLLGLVANVKPSFAFSTVSHALKAAISLKMNEV
jgi:hypothetical protein